jgi:hypothetical protein
MSSHRSLLAALAIVFMACGQQPAPKPHAASTPTATPTPSKPAPALLQVENAPESRPHAGLQAANIVFEYLTEGGITRFTVVFFDPRGGQKVGPDRSARLVALRLVKSYRGVLFYSGASDYVLGKIWDSKTPNLDDRSDGGRYFSRDGSRQPPHNLFTTPDQLAQGVQKSGARITYTLPAPAEPVSQGPAVSKLSFDQTFAHHVDYTYDPGSKTYQYKTDTGLETDAANGNQPLKISNVVVLRVPHHGAGYTEDVRGEEGIDFDLQGQGKAAVYTRGQEFDATWDLSQPDQPLRLLGADGKDLPLPQGLTWVHLADPDMAINTS